jgi:hypothetical protein
MARNHTVYVTKCWCGSVHCGSYFPGPTNSGEQIKNFDRLKRALRGILHSAEAVSAERRTQNRPTERSLISALTTVWVTIEKFWARSGQELSQILTEELFILGIWVCK